MSYTNVPNYIFDEYLKILKPSEMCILLVVIRQTYGWYDKRMKSYKKRDWIAQRFFEKKISLSIRTISSGIEGLIEKGVITITNKQGHLLISAQQRKMASKIFYALKRREVKGTLNLKYTSKKKANFLTDSERHREIMRQKNLHNDSENY
jgi:hypothetical protein